jgi:selenocysteine-specific elongation factor
MAGWRPQVIIGTAGHIDHGKTALVKALTGVDADTLAEEKRRGITIELGFVFLEDPQAACQIVFIDVPGHDRFIKTMVAGASNLDAALLVIAADEGIMPQTREHFDILQLLGVSHGIIALTKADLVDTARLAEVTAQARQLVGESRLAEAPVIPVSAVSGQGLSELQAAMEQMAMAVPRRQDNGVFRLPVDRVFTRQGFGAVVAGTVLGGEIKVGDRVLIYPQELPARVRGLQVHGQPAHSALVGWRTALNLQDVKQEDLYRGQTVASPGALSPTDRLDATLRLLPSQSAPLRNRTRLRLHVGTAEIICRLSLLDREALAPGEEGLAQFVLEAPTVAMPGDRLVVRSFSPLVTLGGGQVLDASPDRHRRFSAEVLEHLRRLQGGAVAQVEAALLGAGLQPPALADLVRLAGQRESELQAALQTLQQQGKLITLGDAPPRYLHESAYRQVRQQLLGALEAYYTAHPQRVYMPAAELQAAVLARTTRAVYEQVLRDLDAGGLVTREAGRLGLAGRQPQLSAEEQRLAESLTDAYDTAGLAAPLESDLRAQWGIREDLWRSVMTSLTEQGILVRLDEKVTYHTRVVGEATVRVRELLAARGSVSVGEVREALGVSRKYVVALLEYLDEQGVTRRQGEVRVLAEKG